MNQELNARTQPLSALLFGDVLVAVPVVFCVRSLKQPSHGKLKFAYSCGQTQVGMCERHKKSATRLENCWRQIELDSILANFFTNFFVLANSYLMADGLDEREATFRFIEELSRFVGHFVSSIQRHKKHASKNAHIRFRPHLSIFPALSDQDIRGNST